MIWIVFALVGALSQATYGMSVKVLQRWVSPYSLAGLSFLSASLVLLAVAVLRGIPLLGPGLSFAVAVTVSINIVATLLMYRALASTDLSFCMPMLSFTPVFLILTSFFILGELPTATGAAGILMVACGAYLLNLEYVEGRPAGLSRPFRTLRMDRGIQSMLAVSFLFSISVNFDKQVVENSDTVFGSVIVFLLLGVAFVVITAIAGRRGGRYGSGPVGGDVDGRDLSPVASRKIPGILACPLVGLVLALEVVSINTAYTMSIVPYVITIKRLAIFFSVLYGGLLLGERELGGRIFGAVVMIAGAGMIALFG